MKYTDLHDKYLELDKIETLELIEAVKAHGGQYVFIKEDNEDSDDYSEGEAPIIPAYQDCSWDSSVCDYFVVRVEITRGKNIAIYGYPVGAAFGEYKIEPLHGFISYITNSIPETDEVKDVSINNTIFYSFEEDLICFYKINNKKKFDYEIVWNAIRVMGWDCLLRRTSEIDGGFDINAQNDIFNPTEDRLVNERNLAYVKPVELTDDEMKIWCSPSPSPEGDTAILMKAQKAGNLYEVKFVEEETEKNCYGKRDCSCYLVVIE